MRIQKDMSEKSDEVTVSKEKVYLKLQFKCDSVRTYTKKRKQSVNNSHYPTTSLVLLNRPQSAE